MFNVMAEIDKVINKYGIEKEKYLKVHIEQLMGEILQEAVSKYGKRVIIRGLKATKSEIHPFLSFVSRYMDIVGIQEQTLQENGFIFVSSEKKVPILPLSDKIVDCDIYLINALISGQGIKYEMEGHLKENKIAAVDIYFELKQRYGVALGKSYDFYDREYDCTSKRIKDAMEKDRVERTEGSLKNLLGQCLCIGDFTSFFRIENEETERINYSEELKQLIYDVKQLIKRIKGAVEERKYKFGGRKDIVWHWIDSINYDEIGLLPRVEKRIKKGMFFSEAYSPTPYTRPTVRTIFWREFRRKDGGKKGAYVPRRLTDSNLYQEIIRQGYHFEVCGSVKKIIDPAYELAEESELCTAASMYYLRMLHTILMSEKPCFVLVHVMAETHMPFVSPWENIKGGGYMYSDVWEKVEEKINISAEYADAVIDFYSELLDQQSIGIYMSDHGKWGFIERRRYKDESIHILLGITNIGIAGNVSRLFSYEKFDCLVQWILQLNKNSVDEMLFGDMEIYSEGYKGSARKQKGDIEDICTGFVGINTTEDKYVVLDNGKEYYFLKEEKESINRIEE